MRHVHYTYRNTTTYIILCHCTDLYITRFGDPSEFRSFSVFVSVLPTYLGRADRCSPTAVAHTSRVPARDCPATDCCVYYNIVVPTTMTRNRFDDKLECSVAHTRRHDVMTFGLIARETCVHGDS